MNSPRSSVSDTPSTLKVYRPEEFRRFFVELHGTHGLMQAWSPKPSTAPVAGVDTGGFADMMRLSERSWSVEAGFGPRPTNRPQAREYDHRLAEARMAFEGFAPDPTIVSGLDELVLAARSTPDLTMDAHARRGFVESSRPRIVELARLATESLLCAFEPARDPYLRVQSVFRTLCEWRYGYEGDQILPSHSPDTLVIGAFLRTVAESLSAVYLADESAQKSTRDDLQAMMRLSQEATALKLSRDSVRRESPIWKMLTDTAGYSAAALLQTWSLVNSASVLLSPNARETLSPVDLSADQWTELADAYAEMLRDGRSHDFAEGILGAVTASGRTDEYPGLNVFCAPPMEGESGTYLCALQVWERRAKPKRDGTDIKPSNEDIARGFADRLLLKLSDKRTALLRLGNDLELSVGGLGPDPLKQVLGAKWYARLRAFSLYWIVQCSVTETQVVSPSDILRELPPGSVRREHGSKNGKSRKVLVEFPRPPKNLVVREDTVPRIRQEYDSDPYRFVNSHARVLRRWARPSYLAFVRSRLRGIKLELRVVGPDARITEERVFNESDKATDHEMAYRRFSALADALESEHRGGGYAIYYETLSGSISPEEAANLAKMGFEIGPGRLREPRASATVATVKVMSAGEIWAILDIA